MLLQIIEKNDKSVLIFSFLKKMTLWKPDMVRCLDFRWNNEKNDNETSIFFSQPYGIFKCKTLFLETNSLKKCKKKVVVVAKQRQRLSKLVYFDFFDDDKFKYDRVT